MTDLQGLPLGYTIVAANEKEYEPLADLLTGTPAKVVVADNQARLAREAKESLDEWEDAHRARIEELRRANR